MSFAQVVNTVRGVGDMEVIVDIPWNVPSKKNSYQVRFSKVFWQRISGSAFLFRQSGQKTYWIGPSKKIKDFERNMATYFALKCPDFGKMPVGISITTGQRNDVDNLPGAILDALQKSGRIHNDKQVQILTVKRIKKREETTVRISSITQANQNNRSNIST